MDSGEFRPVFNSAWRALATSFLPLAPQLSRRSAKMDTPHNLALKQLPPQTSVSASCLSLVRSIPLSFLLRSDPPLKGAACRGKEHTLPPLALKILSLKLAIVRRFLKVRLEPVTPDHCSILSFTPPPFGFRPIFCFPCDSLSSSLSLGLPGMEVE